MSPRIAVMKDPEEQSTRYAVADAILEVESGGGTYIEDREQALWEWFVAHAGEGKKVGDV